MKLKTAIRGLYDTVASPARRLDAIAFMRRYSHRGRPLSHYACRGETAGTVVSLLKSLGFEDERDYTVVSSSLDPETKSIRWTASGRISELASELAAAEDAMPHVFDALAARPTADPETAAAPFADRSSDSTAPDADRFAGHFLRKLSARSDAILRELAETDPETMTLPPNGKEALKCAVDWAKAVKDNPDRPFVLPLPVLEAYARTRTRLRSVETPFLFRQGGRSLTLCRVTDSREKIPATGLMQGPLDELTGGDNNPMDGYLYSSTDKLMKADLSNKDLCVVFCDAPMFFNEGEDLIHPVKTAFLRRAMWTYVHDMYRACYPDMADCIGMTNHMRVAVSDRSATWSQSIGSPSSTKAGHNAQRAARAVGSERMTAKFMMFFAANGAAPECRDVTNFLQSDTWLKVRTGDPETGRPDFSGDGLTVDEMAWEWFDMTHGLMSKRLRPSYVYGRPTGDSEHSAANLAIFRRLCKSATAKTLTAASCPDTCPGMAPDGDENYTPVSAFVSGAIPVALRLAFHDGRMSIPLKRWTGSDPALHPDDVIVSNVYSGICTDRSPGIAESTGDVFPKPYGEIDLATLDRTVDANRRKAVSAWLARLAKGSQEQVRFAQRTKGTPRCAVMVVETNVDAGAMSAANADEIVARTGTAFVQNILLRRCDPYASTDECISSASTHAAYRRYDKHEQLTRCFTDAWRNAAEEADELNGAAAATFPQASGDVGVTALADADGRLVLVFSVTGRTLAYARYAYRFESDMPLVTAHMRSKCWTPGTEGFVVMPGCESRFESVTSLLRAIHDVRCATPRTSMCGVDYSGGETNGYMYGAFGPEHRYPMATVPPGCAPEKEWFTAFGRYSFEHMVE